MTQLLIITQFVLAGIITVAVLLQKSSSIGLGAYSGSNESLFGAKGPAGFLAKFTAIMGIIFVINTISLGYFYQKEYKSSVIDNIDTKNIVVPEPKTNIVPDVPISNQIPQAPASSKK